VGSKPSLLAPLLGLVGKPHQLPDHRVIDEALDRFCDEWNRGTADQARFEKEYLLAVGTRR
jgi:hypothetical protein